MILLGLFITCKVTKVYLLMHLWYCSFTLKCELWLVSLRSCKLKQGGSLTAPIATSPIIYNWTNCSLPVFTIDQVTFVLGFQFWVLEPKSELVNWLADSWFQYRTVPNHLKPKHIGTQQASWIRYFCAPLPEINPLQSGKALSQKYCHFLQNNRK